MIGIKASWEHMWKRASWQNGGMTDRDFHSSFEDEIREILGKRGIEVDQTTKLLIKKEDGTTTSYRPDFRLTNVKSRDGKEILMEVHGSQFFAEGNGEDGHLFLEKMSAFMKDKELTSKYKLVIVSDSRFREYAETVMRKSGYKKEDICDELWFLPAEVRVVQTGYRATKSVAVVPKLAQLNLVRIPETSIPPETLSSVSRISSEPSSLLSSQPPSAGPDQQTQPSSLS